MAKRRTLDRRTLRDEADAAERQKGDGETTAEPTAADADAEVADDDAKAKPKKKAAAKVKAPAKPRTRTAKVTRMKIVWGVFSNSHSLAEEFDYPHKAEAEALMLKLNTDKKSGHPFFLQPVKKPLDK